MGGLSRLLAASLLAALVVVPHAVSSRGYGMGSEKNAAVQARALADCPPEYRDKVTGKCLRSHRNVMRRGVRGGGYGFGK